MGVEAPLAMQKVAGSDLDKDVIKFLGKIKGIICLSPNLLMTI